MSDREKEKGNEAYHANDLEEALAYYKRSLQCMPTVAVNNNMALLYSRMNKDSKVVEVCNDALKMDPDNIKSHLRRAKALKHLQHIAAARSDAQWVLAKEPNNKLATEILQGLADMAESSNLTDTSTESTDNTNSKKKRILIEEVSSESNSEHIGNSSVSFI